MKPNTILSATLITTMMITSGCHSYYGVNVHQQSLNNGRDYLLQPPLYSGDKIRYQLKNGDKGTLTVSRSDPQNIYADDGRVLPVSQISQLEKREISNGKTAAAVGGGSVVVVAIVATALLGIVLTGVFAGS
ncbi:hypothetical protein BL250_13865 [Erwinia sp. OLTSP20]|uniref:hypothetical protein n=1 Tax=unclassified Erwinia TaxID=2622719 RepID=UPI000C18298A|nr:MULTISPECIES: hypothetical protein [unclassified Erwinia]PIJ50338.1 hypothetical protein BV501_09765 [Erwinia sp. OAMSP11]PIJ72175.1 hypothetical protein BK416_10655 [Erwinia sp. OLSSP12]PIJ81466.1 hypothetical protein BLD47_09480 [Erwinia sp. OLCASP19]PIJ84172.1 hypothetical protein BLD46_09060 [Erwinia sp. OLMTSP26]PIJ85871.1 hypothetical protein BLD49_10280 [Erwinia sp. OLMDSP33]